MSRRKTSGMGGRTAASFVGADLPMVSIIVPCRNEKNHFSQFAKSLIRQDYPSQKLEVIVADGMSNDGTREILDKICAQYSHIQVIDNPGQIVPTGLNKAILTARGDIIVRMDVHTKYASDYVAACVGTLVKTGAANVGGPARTITRTFLQKAIATAYHSRFAVGGASFHFEHIEGYVDTVVYGCWRKETLLKIGLFDEDLARNQDDELNFRLQKAGLKIWQNPAIRSWYYPRSRLRDLFKQYFQYGFWKWMVIRKHRRPASLRHLVPGGFVLTLSFLLLLSPFVPLAKGILWTTASAYVLFLLAGSISASCQSGWFYFPVLPLVLFTYHMAYAFGFLYGLFFSFPRSPFRRKSTSSLTSLSR